MSQSGGALMPAIDLVLLPEPKRKFSRGLSISLATTFIAQTRLQSVNREQSVEI